MPGRAGAHRYNESMQSHLEVELKFEAPASATLPAVWPAGLRLLTQAKYTLQAKYFDTPKRQLAQHGIAVRQRSGGHDAGWHCKARLADNTQREWLFAPAADAPEQLLSLVRELVPVFTGGLETVAEINTQRTSLVLGVDGVPLYEIADDAVRALAWPDQQRRAWREWEVEALTQRQDELPALSAALLQQGAQVSLADSKIRRAVGALVQSKISKQAGAAQVAAAQIIDLADRLQAADAVQLALVAHLREIAKQVSSMSV